jgi:magnesium transporter
MLKVNETLTQIEKHIDEVLSEETTLGKDLWQLLIEQHPADIATLVEQLEEEITQVAILKKLPTLLSCEVFENLNETLQPVLLVLLDIKHATIILKKMHANELADVLDHLSDKDLEKYLKLLQHDQRNTIISLLSFDPHSAGGRMNNDVITLQKDFTVKQSIDLLRRLRLHKDLLQRLYVTNSSNILVGHITLDQLFLNPPQTPLSTIIQKNEVHILVNEDQEDAARQIRHYHLQSAPVVDQEDHFLGAITATDVVSIMEEEESEDVYKRFGLSTIEHSYFATPAWKLVMQRSIWLIGLLLFQSVSSLIMGHYDLLLKQYTILSVFLGMLIGTGGNAGNQSATLVIRGLTTKEMSRRNVWKVLLREFWIAVVIGTLLVCAGFSRIYFSKYYSFTTALAISVSLFIIVVISMLVGSIIPILLDFFNLDPAHSAAPFLTTFMDILGVVILFLIFSAFLG